MSKNTFWLLLFLIVGNLLPAAYPTYLTYSFKSAEDNHRFQLLTQEVRCVVCQNQTIYDSNAPLANDLRKKIYDMVLEDKSDKEIKDYLVNRYGEFILLKPKFKPLTYLLWLFPFVGLLFSALVIFCYQKKSLC